MRALPVIGTVLTAVLLAGCGASGPTPQQWTDSMCTAVQPFVRTAVTAPRAGSTPEEQIRSLSDYLGHTTEALDRTLGDLDRLGPAPVDGGETVAATLSGGFGDLRSAFAGAKARVTALDPADPAAVERGMPGALEPVTRLTGTTDPLSAVTSRPELDAAFRASPTCTDLTRLTDSARAQHPNGATSPAPNGSEGEGGGG